MRRVVRAARVLGSLGGSAGAPGGTASPDVASNAPELLQGLCRWLSSGPRGPLDDAVADPSRPGTPFAGSGTSPAADGASPAPEPIDGLTSDDWCGGAAARYYAEVAGEDAATLAPAATVRWPGSGAGGAGDDGATTLDLRAGTVARSADGSCLATLGGNSVLAAVWSPDEGDLAAQRAGSGAGGAEVTVFVRRRSAASGMIPGSRDRRDRPSSRDAALGHSIERVLVPLLPAGFSARLFVEITPLTLDPNTDTLPLLVNAALAALHTSSHPTLGPAAAVRVALTHAGGLVVSPDAAQLREAAQALLYVGAAGAPHSDAQDGCVYAETMAVAHGRGQAASRDALRRLVAAARGECGPLVAALRQLGGGLRTRPAVLASADAAATAVVEACAGGLLREALVPGTRAEDHRAAPTVDVRIPDQGGVSGDMSEAAADNRRPFSAGGDLRAPSGVFPAGGVIAEAAGVARRLRAARAACDDAGPARLSAAMQTLRELPEAVKSYLLRKGLLRVQKSRVPGSGMVSAADVGLALQDLHRRYVLDAALSGSPRVDGRGLEEAGSLKFEPLPRSGAVLGSLGESAVYASAVVTSDPRDVMAEDEDVATRGLSHAGEDNAAGMIVHCGRAMSGSRGRRASSAAISQEDSSDSMLLERALSAAVYAPVGDGEGAPPGTFPFGTRVQVERMSGAASALPLLAAAASAALHSAGVPMQGGLVGGGRTAVLREGGPEGAVAAKLPPGPCGAHEGLVGPRRPGPEGYCILTDPSSIEEAVADALVDVFGPEQEISSLRVSLPRAGCPPLPLDMLLEAVERASEHRDSVVATLRDTLAPSKASWRSLSVAQGEVRRLSFGGMSLRKRIEAKSGARISIAPEPSSSVAVYAPDAAAMQAALDALSHAVRIVDGAAEGAAGSPDGLAPRRALEVGKRYSMRVKFVRDTFAVLTEVDPDGPGHPAEGLLHISEVSPRRIERMQSALAPGTVVEVECIRKQANGTMEVSRKAVEARQALGESGSRKEEGR
ncbi:unnamed protein product [Pedinophyceae sp. YPF-701]|nr:unnamed protein product [Pedinophyceae sp. YPF-701]